MSGATLSFITFLYDEKLVTQNLGHSIPLLTVKKGVPTPTFVLPFSLKTGTAFNQSCFPATTMRVVNDVAAM